MIKSMTGFGRAEVADASRKFTVEIKSVNHRYLDVNIKLPKTRISLRVRPQSVKGIYRARQGGCIYIL